MSFKIYCSNGHANESIGGAKPIKCKKCNVNFSTEASVPISKPSPIIKVLTSRSRGYDKNNATLNEDMDDSVNDIPEIDSLSFEVENTETTAGRSITLDTAMFGMSKPFSPAAKKTKLSKVQRREAYNSLMDSIKPKNSPKEV